MNLNPKQRSFATLLRSSLGRLWKAGCVCLLLLLFFTLAGSGYYAFRIEPNTITLRNQTVELKNWHAEHDGLRVMLISDIHQGKTAAEFDRIEKIVELANSSEPDLVFLLGDYVGEEGRRSTPEDIAEVLSGLKSKYGIYAVLGNHDWWYDGERVRRALEKYNIKVLENSCIPVKIKGQSLNILGLPDRGTRPWFLEKNGVAKTDEKHPMLVLSHSPDYFREVKIPFELMLSGHTHGGQIALPLLGALIVPSDYGKEQVKGLLDAGEKKLFITIGVGTSFIGARFLCPPEIVLLTLRRGE